MTERRINQPTNRPTNLHTKQTKMVQSSNQQTDSEELNRPTILPNGPTNATTVRPPNQQSDMRVHTYRDVTLPITHIQTELRSAIFLSFCLCLRNITFLIFYLCIYKYIYVPLFLSVCHIITSLIFYLCIYMILYFYLSFYIFTLDDLNRKSL